MSDWYDEDSLREMVPELEAEVAALVAERDGLRAALQAVHNRLLIPDAIGAGARLLLLSSTTRALGAAASGSPTPPNETVGAE